ncbi:large repetitive protein [Amycolatopsis sp. lyj-90]|uniref:large repetitive protein n=1 Tax=Amycolatopsis sp. lyj-90 TaxID=2789285 RepID=UPI00397C12C0
MSSTKPTLVGQYTGVSPALEPNTYSSVADIDNVVTEIIYNDDGSKAGASRSDPAWAWHELDADLKTAEKALADINDRFAKQIKAVRDVLEGKAGEAFDKYANAVLKISEELYSTLSTKQFAANMSNIGNAVQAFATDWWKLHESRDSKKAEYTESFKAAAKKDVMKNVANSTAIFQQLEVDLREMRSSLDQALLQGIRDRLGVLAKQYNARGAELVPLYISDGDTTTGNPNTGEKPKEANANKPPAKTETSEPKAETPQPKTETPEPKAEKPQETPPGNAFSELKPTTPGAETTPIKSTEPPAAGLASPGPVEPGAAGEGIGGSPGEQQGAGGAEQGGPSPQEQQALQQAKNAAGEAIGNLAGQTQDPARQNALGEAKQAAEKAIDGLGNMPGAGGEGAAGPGGTDPGVGGIPAAMPQALTDAKNAAAKAIDGLTAKTEDPKRKKALDEAKEAAEEAIDGLASPTGGPGQLTGGPGESDLKAAKEAAGKAIDDLAKQGDSDGRQTALKDAKNAALEAMGGLSDQPGGPEWSDPADREGREQLLETKQAAEKAIDDLICDTDDPERKQALEDAKAAVSDAIDKSAAPEHYQLVQDAKGAADKAIDGLRAEGDDQSRTHALDAAKTAAEKAIGEISDAPELTGPAHTEALEHAKQEAGKAIDALSAPDDTPAEKQELAATKEAVNKAIDGIAAGDKGNAMSRFLDPGESGGAGLTGGPAAGGGGSGGGPAAGVGPTTGGVGSGGAPGGRFDTQPFQGGSGLTTQGGPAAPAVPGPGQVAANAAQGGMPMGPMGPMGGGGMGGGGPQGEKEREPEIWMQAEPGAWGNGESDEQPPSHVLGRN